MKYPLQKELEKDLNDALNRYTEVITNPKSTTQELNIALAYLNAIKRINNICVNRKRF